jgi:DNA-binding CsgD family transcriptional regulator
VNEPAQAAEERLRRAIAAVPGDDLVASLGEVARAMPVPLGLETVGIRARAEDGERAFHLLAMDGASPREIARRALDPYALALLRSQFALGPAHSLARNLGIRWVGGRWIVSHEEPIGVLSAGSRTDRQPTPAQEELFTRVAEDLAPALKGIDRSTQSLELLSASLAKESLALPGTPPSPALEPLRPRERTILALYAEGLPAEEIARMLIISPHTVRTHVKNAFRRLGIHSRSEAAELVHTDEVARVL